MLPHPAPTASYGEAEAGTSAAARLAQRHSSYGRSSSIPSSAGASNGLQLDTGPANDGLAASFAQPIAPKLSGGFGVSTATAGLGLSGVDDQSAGRGNGYGWSSRSNDRLTGPSSGIDGSRDCDRTFSDGGETINNIEPSFPQTSSTAAAPRRSPPSLRILNRPIYPSYDVPPPQAAMYNPYRRPHSPRRKSVPASTLPEPLSLPFTTVPYRPPLTSRVSSFYSDTEGGANIPPPTPTTDDASDTPGPTTTAVGGSRAGSKRKYKYTRTKTGCLCCRRRRVKCDEAKPTCLKKILIMQCEYAEGDSPSQENSTAGESGDEVAERPQGTMSQSTQPPPVPKPKGKRVRKAPIVSPLLDQSFQEDQSSLFEDVEALIGQNDNLVERARRNTLQEEIQDDLPQVEPNGLFSSDQPPPMSSDGSVARYRSHPPVGIGTNSNPVDSFAASNDMGQVSQAWGGAGAAPMLVSPDFLLPWFPTSEERNLILHYCANAADLMMAIPSGLNPMLAINLPLALDSPRGTNPASDALRIALLGVGAVHQAFLLARSGVSAGQTAGIFQYAASLRSSGKAMVRVAAADPEASRSDAALGAATSLALIDMLFGGTGWEDNFNLARGMIIARGGPAEMLKASLPTALADGVTVSSARLNLEVLAIYETMGCLTTGQEPLLLSDQWENWWFGSSRSTYEEHSVEKQFGMSRKMVHLFARLTRLLARVGGGFGGMEVALEARKMGEDVDAWIESLQITTLEHERVQVGNRAYAHTMKVCNGRDMKLIEKILLLRNVYMIPRTDIRVQSAAIEVLHHCSTSVALLGMSIDLTWPTIIAASCIEGDARQWVLSLFEGFKTQCCFDIETAARIVREVWARLDKGLPRDDWKQVCEDLGLRVLYFRSYFE